MSEVHDAAINAEAKLYSLRKSKDGVIVGFVFHPQDVPPELLTCEIGQRIALAMVGIKDEA